MTHRKEKALLILILLLALAFRSFGINWDQGFHLHPDERMIVMVAERLTPTSLNPHFFAYGSFPLYLLKTSGIVVAIFSNNPFYSQYGGLSQVGRSLSVIFDLLTIILIYKITKITLTRTFNKAGLVAFLACLIYALAVFPIQAAHFYAVDILLTFLSLLTVYRLLIFFKRPTNFNSILVGIAFGLSLATKITIILLLFPIILSCFLLYLKNKSFTKNILFLLFILLGAFFAFSLTMPYAFFAFTEFKTQILEQLKMNSNPYIFPFTLQYVGSTPYLYYLKNIFYWGLGIPVSLVTIGGVIILTVKAIKEKNQFLLIILGFSWFYFLVIGRSAVKFMRYLLPLYPFFAIFAAYFLVFFLLKIQKKINRYCLTVFCFLLFTLILIWPLSFVTIYQKTHTRLSASYWINRHIPPNSFLAVEHWDDRLPLLGAEKFQFLELPLYERDTSLKWNNLTVQLENADYLILASNRLYTPLQRLSSYPSTNNYYKKLFTEELGFEKVAEFTSYPKIPFLDLEIIDDSADESFTVYDHPKIIIFKNTKHFSREELFRLITQ